ncbi:DUF742 domain-containing protein [Streptomyces sp. SL13]|uniref:DUF742 domain-containing protein n=1 Tax=Streptantibioticus silvisoli TaxID=2705255 RepID=A0AA90H1E0_9ACTN|nr:DUF742 domain-containing protein [Streptantibioticus silvisoli]MDI5963701.1 DUF742 domain-containing protein [Streptantibioticus silvisoli]MDI5969541.1 DUF742 domain-containing protein [Streptantibioticus silvisoli]
MNGDQRGRSSPFVRPYAVTGGRTTARHDFALEALVSTNMRAWDSGIRLSPEHRAICRLCMELKSVAEISALLNVPLGVTRVLVGDLAESGLVNVQQPGQGGGRPDVTLLERVLVGLRGL